VAQLQELDGCSVKNKTLIVKGKYFWKERLKLKSVTQIYEDRDVIDKFCQHTHHFGFTGFGTKMATPRLSLICSCCHNTYLVTHLRTVMWTNKDTHFDIFWYNYKNVVIFTINYLHETNMIFFTNADPNPYSGGTKQRNVNPYQVFVLLPFSKLFILG
jgi:hypothetical protein